MAYLHQKLAAGRWQEFSLAEQLGNIGSEVGRALRWRGKDDNLFQGAADRALELLGFTLEDARWHGRLREIARAQEVLCDAFSGGMAYGSTLEDCNRYFFLFAVRAALAREGNVIV